MTVGSSGDEDAFSTKAGKDAVDAVQKRWDALHKRQEPLRDEWREHRAEGVLSLEEFCVDVLGKGHPMPWEAVMSGTLEEAARQWEVDLDFAESAAEKYSEYLLTKSAERLRGTAPGPVAPQEGEGEDAFSTKAGKLAVDVLQKRWDVLHERLSPLRDSWREHKDEGVLSLEEFSVDVLGKRYPMPWEAAIAGTLEEAAKQWAADLDFAESAAVKYAEYLLQKSVERLVGTTDGSGAPPEGE